MGVHFLTRYRNPLAYPAGYTPGFDPSHVAAKGMSAGRGLSIVQTGGTTLVDLLTGVKGVVNGTPSFEMNGIIGPSVNYDSGTDYTQFSGMSTAAHIGGYTYGAIIFQKARPNGFNCIIGDNTAVKLLQISSAGLLSIYDATFVSLTIPLNVPFFVAGSSIGTTTVNLVAKNLITGETITATHGAANVSFTSDGSVRVGNFNGSNQDFRGLIAAAMYSPSPMSMPTLLAWAADPWSFWYPNPGDNWIAAQAAAGGLFKITGNPRSLAGFGGGLAA